MFAIRFVVWFVAVIAGAVYTVIQSGGPDPAGVALCKLVQKIIPSTTEQCVPAFPVWGPTAILIVTIIFILLGLIDLLIWVRKKSRPNIERREAANKIQSIEINYGEDGPFERLTKTDMSRLERMLSVEFKNPHADIAITNCKLEITDIEPFVGYRRSLVVKENFSLAGGDHDFIPFVKYGESRVGDEKIADTVVALLAPKGDDPWFLAALPHDVENILTLRATAMGAAFREEKVVVWVGAGTRLRIRKFDAVKDDGFISLEDATKQAYGAARGTRVGSAAETMNKNGVLVWFAFYYHTMEIPIYGNVRNSTKFEPVLFRNIDIKMESDKMIGKEIYGDLIWENMQVTRRILQMGKQADKPRKRFDRLLHAMATQPAPSEMPVKEVRTSAAAASSSYGDTRTRAGKAASASSKPKRKSH